MVTYYNRTDLVKFGEYLLSKERRELYESNFKEQVRCGIDNPLSVEEAMTQVSHADVENWKETLK